VEKEDENLALGGALHQRSRRFLGAAAMKTEEHGLF